MPFSYFGQQAIHCFSTSYNFTVVPLSSTSKSLPIDSNLTLHICYIMFEEKVLSTFKEMGRIKYCCNFLILKPEERCFFRNTQQFQGLDIVGTHVTHGGNNFQSCIVAGIKDLHQEINKHLTLCFR